MGHNYMGHTYMDYTYVGHNYIGHTYVGHNYVGHNYIGHNYTGIVKACVARACVVVAQWSLSLSLVPWQHLWRSRASCRAFMYSSHATSTRSSKQLSGATFRCTNLYRAITIQAMAV